MEVTYFQSNFWAGRRLDQAYEMDSTAKANNEELAYCGAQFASSPEKIPKALITNLIANEWEKVTGNDKNLSDGTFHTSKYSIQRWLDQKPQEDHWTPRRK